MPDESKILVDNDSTWPNTPDSTKVQSPNNTPTVKGKSQVPRMLRRLQPLNKPGLTEWMITLIIWLFISDLNDILCKVIHVVSLPHCVQGLGGGGAYMHNGFRSFVLMLCSTFFQNKPLSLSSSIP